MIPTVVFLFLILTMFKKIKYQLCFYIISAIFSISSVVVFLMILFELDIFLLFFYPIISLMFFSYKISSRYFVRFT